MKHLVPGPLDLWFLPLGGTGEIGMNMNLYGHDGQWLMIDCGVTFNAPLQPDDTTAYELVAADPSFIAERKDQLVGLIVTHAHEDHVGAVAYLWRKFECPVYTTAFTAEVLRRKLAALGLIDQVPIHVVHSFDRVSIGSFNVEWLPVTHSIPEPHSVVIRTTVGNVLHTGDWKIDNDPVVGAPFNADQFRELAYENITAMVCDSTNATREGRSVSEGECYDGLHEIVETATGRVVVACFGSNVARLITLGHIAQQTGRRMALLGRSLKNMVATAKAAGIWPEAIKVVESGHLPYLPPAEVLAVATGSQGEPRTALSRLSTDQFYDFSIDAGDTVIFSSMVIPGNEFAVERIIKNLKRKKVTIIQNEDYPKPIHASGHPCRNEVADLYRWVKPSIVVPVHGELEHLTANAQLAKSSGVKMQLIGKNGDLFMLSGNVRIKANAVTVGRIELKN